MNLRSQKNLGFSPPKTSPTSKSLILQLLVELAHPRKRLRLFDPQDESYKQIANFTIAG